MRRLMELTVTSAPPPGVLAEAAAQVAGVCADALASAVPEEGPEPVGRGRRHPARPRRAVPTSRRPCPSTWWSAPAIPWRHPSTSGSNRPGPSGAPCSHPSYEGAPGCVHGAAIAAAFDIVLTAANVAAGAAGPTVELTIRYRRPTIVGVESRFEAWVTESTDRRTFSTGRLLQDGVVTVEATGEFVNLTRERVNAMHRDRRRRHGGGVPVPRGGAGIL